MVSPGVVVDQGYCWLAFYACAAPSGVPFLSSVVFENVLPKVYAATVRHDGKDAT
jgi:hypothetical protein